MMHPGFSDYIQRLRSLIARTTVSGSATAPTGFDEPEFNALALALFELQFEAVAPYQRFCRAREITPESVATWQTIPALPVTTFKEYDVTSLGEEERSAVFHSSGTTRGRASRHFHSAQTLQAYESSLLPWFQAHLISKPVDSPAPMRFVALTPDRSAAPRSSLVYMFDAVIRQFGSRQAEFIGMAAADGDWTLDFARVQRVLAEAEKSGTCVVLLGTAFSYVQLLQALDAEGCRFNLAPGSRILETGGYKGKSREIPKAELYQWIEHRLGVQQNSIVSEYGMSELSSQAYDGVSGQIERRLFRFPPWARAQVISPENGQEVAEGHCGLLRVLDLANVASVLSIQTEDLAIRSGRGFEWAGRTGGAQAKGCSLLHVA